MALIIALVRLLLSAVFGVAGMTKLWDQPGTREAVVNFGAPKSVAPSLAVMLPVLELAIALGLLFTATAWWSAVAGLFVLGLFVAAISVNLARGKTHECHCFGQIYSRPLGWPTLARNLIFALAAGLVLWQGAEFQPNILLTIERAVAGFNTWQALVLVAVAAAVVGVFYFERRQKSHQQPDEDRPSGLPVGSEALAFDLPAYEGGHGSLADLLTFGKPVLLIFTNPKCTPCINLFQEIKDWQHAHHQQLTIALLSRGTIKDNFVNVERNRLGQVLLQEKNEVAKEYGARYTPSAVMISTEGRIASEVAEGAEEIRGLLKSHVQTSQVSFEPADRGNPSQDPNIQPSPAIR